MKRILIIGAGNLGSRHLQSLKSVEHQLEIFVIDPNPESIKIAKERYNSIPKGNYIHEVKYFNEIENFGELIDIAIIATTSKMRKDVIEKMFDNNEVKFLILEKILFQKKKDYFTVKELIEKRKCSTWVNCPMPMQPIFQEIKKNMGNKEIIYTFSGCNYGLLTNLIHFVDFMVYLLDENDFVVETSNLKPTLVSAKRDGFMELYGTIQIHFNNGSHGIFTCYSSGNLPLISEFITNEVRYIIRESEGKAWIWNPKENTEWIAKDIKIMYQSQLTKIFVEELLKTGTCILTTYEKSMEIHLKLYDAILQFINQNSEKKYTEYLFT